MAIPLEQTDMEREAHDYAERWWAEESNATFHIGYSNFEAWRALICAVEVARLCCDGREAIPYALRLAQLLIEKLDHCRRSPTRALTRVGTPTATRRRRADASQ